MKKLLNLEDMVKLPKKLRFKKFENKVLVLAPEKPNWVVTDDNGLQLIYYLIDGKTIRNSIKKLISNNRLDEDEAINIAKNVLSDIETYEFYEDADCFDVDKLSLPTRLQLYLTNDCNLRCKHCYMSATSALENELSTSEWKEVITEFNKLVGPTLIAFSGGEPLKRKDFMEIIEYAKQQGNETFLFTNGTLITKENINKLVQNIDQFQISIDGATKYAHESVRGKGSFEKTINGLNLLKENEGVKILISYCMVPENLEDVNSNLIKFIESLNIKNIKLGLSVARKVGRWEQNCSGCKDYSLGELYPLLEDTLMEIYSRKLDSPSYNRNMIKRNCTFGQRFVVSSTGDVFPCAEKVCSVGNVRNESMDMLYKKLIELHEKTSVENTPTCSSCDLKYICRGGCKTLRAQNFGTPLIQKCDENRKLLIYQKLFDDSIR